jgi:hypothetical protein
MLPDGFLQSQRKGGCLVGEGFPPVRPWSDLTMIFPVLFFYYSLRKASAPRVFGFPLGEYIVTSSFFSSTWLLEVGVGCVVLCAGYCLIRQ